MIYLAKNNDGTRVLIHSDIEAMFDLDGVTPEMEITDEEFYAAGSLVRVINGEILLGKTEAEKEEEEKLFEIERCKAGLLAIDQESGAGRAVRGLALSLAGKAGVKNDDLSRLQAFEGRAELLRENLEKLTQEEAASV